MESTAPSAVPTAREPLIVPSQQDDLSTHLHRQVIGWLGAALPFAVVVLDRLRPTTGLQPEHLTSVSAYYYSGGVVIFVGILAALAVHLFTYQGYGNEGERDDRRAAIVAGCAALGVALFPTKPPSEAVQLDWWSAWQGYVHYTAAIALFGAFIYFSLALFPRHAPGRVTSEKAVRNVTYRIYGIGMIGCMVWAGAAAAQEASIFLPEACALVLFAMSWLTKGKADQTTWRLLKRGARATRLMK